MQNLCSASTLWEFSRTLDKIVHRPALLFGKAVAFRTNVLSLCLVGLPGQQSPCTSPATTMHVCVLPQVASRATCRAWLVPSLR